MSNLVVGIFGWVALSTVKTQRLGMGQSHNAIWGVYGFPTHSNRVTRMSEEIIQWPTATAQGLTPCFFTVNHFVG